jgi:hypothetical protein
MSIRRARSLLLLILIPLLTQLGVMAPARAVDLGSTSFASATSVGLHNTYNDTTQYPYLAQALDAGATLIELDTWANVFNGHWDVSHDDPIASINNCNYAPTAAQLYTGSVNQNLDSCLGDINVWLTAHPTSNPIMVKIEMKNGFWDPLGMNATELDSYIAAHLGNVVYKPVSLLTKPDGTLYPNLDAAAQAGNWPTRSSLRGKAVVEIIPGTFEQAVSPSSTWVDVVYAAHLKSLMASGQIASAEVFPSVLGAQAGDPRTRYSDTTLRPWFVVFDGDAATYVNDGNTEWYNTNHYIVIATDAQNVAPALDQYSPSLANAQARVALLAADSVSFVSCDWYNSPGDAVLPTVLARG